MFLFMAAKTSAGGRHRAQLLVPLPHSPHRQLWQSSGYPTPWKFCSSNPRVDQGGLKFLQQLDHSKVIYWYPVAELSASIPANACRLNGINLIVLPLQNTLRVFLELLGCPVSPMTTQKVVSPKSIPVLRSQGGPLRHSYGNDCNCWCNYVCRNMDFLLSFKWAPTLKHGSS